MKQFAVGCLAAVSVHAVSIQQAALRYDPEDQWEYNSNGDQPGFDLFAGGHGLGPNLAFLSRIEQNLDQAREKSAQPAKDDKKVLIVIEEDDEAAEGESSESGEDDDEELEPLAAKVVEKIEDGFEELAVENDMAENDAIEDAQEE